MEQLSRIIASILVVCAAVFGLTGCGDDESRVDDIALVVGPHSGAPRFTADLLAQPLAALDAEGDRLTVVVADGDPFVAYDYTIGNLPGNSLDRREELEKLRDDATAAILTLVAKTDEVDLAEAIALAARAFRRDADRHSLTVLDPGFATAGVMSLLEGNLYTDADVLVTNAEQQGALPDLTGLDVEVEMPRLGIVVDPQPQPSEAARSALAAIWTEFFARSGADDVRLAPTAMAAVAHEDASALPHVTPVPIERPAPVDAGGCRRLLGTQTIGFAVGSAELSDPEAAQRTVAAVVEDIGECPGRWLVEGSASSEGSSEANTLLAGGRGETVRDILAAEAHVDPDEIEVKGWGVEWPCRRPDLDADGQLILAAAVYNRTVVVSKGAAGTC